LRNQFPESDRLRWLGMIDDDEVASRLAGADVLCAPSLYGESFGMVLLEAMAAGCVVVASDLDGYRAAAGGHAVLVAPGDAGALTAALGEVLGEVATGTGRGAPGAGEGALAHAQHWSMDRLAQRYVEVYERALAVHRDGGRKVV
jgi:phosphatidylinositol alpha-mannosyltransferase